jgi:hypothetical protein
MNTGKSFLSFNKSRWSRIRFPPAACDIQCVIYVSVLSVPNVSLNISYVADCIFEHCLQVHILRIKLEKIGEVAQCIGVTYRDKGEHYNDDVIIMYLSVFFKEPGNVVCIAARHGLNVPGFKSRRRQ